MVGPIEVVGGKGCRGGWRGEGGGEGEVWKMSDRVAAMFVVVGGGGCRGEGVGAREASAEGSSSGSRGGGGAVEDRGGIVCGGGEVLALMCGVRGGV